MSKKDWTYEELTAWASDIRNIEALADKIIAERNMNKLTRKQQVRRNMRKYRKKVSSQGN